MHKEIESFLNSAVSGCEAVATEQEVGSSWVTVKAEKILDVCKALKSDSNWQMNVLQVITAVDYPEEEQIEVNYILTSYLNFKGDLILKARVPRANPEIDSVYEVWKAADFQEREAYDMLGVTFRNHPDHRRILCPEDWVGFPLRKDYEVEKVYRGMTVNPEEKMNIPDREFVDYQKEMEKKYNEIIKGL